MNYGVAASFSSWSKSTEKDGSISVCVCVNAGHLHFEMMPHSKKAFNAICARGQ
jgi:hypothetical protein